MLKAEGRDVKNHPVVYKLAHMKTLLEKLKPIDEKVDIEVSKVLKADVENQDSEVSESENSGS